MRAIISALTMLAFCATNAHALDEELAAKSCQSLEADMTQFTSKHAAELLLISRDEFRVLFEQSPMMQVLFVAMADLDDKAIARIKTSLVERFIPSCMTPTDHGLPDDVTVGAALDKAVASLGLDRTAPRWGLIDLPDIDFAKQPCHEILNAYIDLPDKAWLNPVNDFLRLAMEARLPAYDLSTPEAEAAANMLVDFIGFECGPGTSEPFDDMFARLATEQGLERK